MNDQRILDPGKCGYCHRPVIFGLLQNGRRRTFEPEPKPVNVVVERDRYAVSKRLGRVVDLVGIASPPSVVLAAHYCAAYAEKKLMGRMAKADAAVIEALSQWGRP
jgi:hypothetical protein